MNKLEAEDLAEKAREFLDREIDVYVIEERAQLPRDLRSLLSRASRS
jgi:hypothetical protein